MGKTVAILTGDLVGSTAALPKTVEATMRLLAVCAMEIGPDSRFTRFRGDGWQLCLEMPGDCLWACLYILARLKADGALSTRIAVGIGEEYPTDSKDLSAAIGPAFTASGHALDQMKQGQTLALAGDGLDKFRHLTFAFADDYASRWSVEQAEAMKLALSPAFPTQDAIAKSLGISRQAVGSRLKAAGYSILDRAHLAFLDDYVWEENP